MVDEPTKKAARTTSTAAKKATRSPRAAAKSSTTSVKEDPRPLEGHAGILVSYAVLASSVMIGLRRKRSELRSLSPMDLLLYGLATQHLSRTITKDSVTAVLRSPFTRFKEPAGEGEVNEDVIGTGARHAVGELITCPFCIAQWVATALVAGTLAAPSLTTAVVSVSAAARVSDYLDLVYGILRTNQ
jgi:Protein of unknown function (DUF1360)